MTGTKKMKVLEPKVTILMMIHMKPYAWEALESLEKQTRKDFEVVVLDSGQWIGKDDKISVAMEAIYKSFHWKPRFEWLFTGEDPFMHKVVAPLCYYTNKAMDLGLIRGEYFATFYDDDLYYPNFIEKMASFLETNPDYDAVRCTEEWIVVGKDGKSVKTKELKADRDILKGEDMVCKVDGMQVMMRTKLINDVSLPRLPLELDKARWSDGYFFNDIGKVMTKMGYIEEPLCRHRFTPISAYTPS